MIRVFKSPVSGLMPGKAFIVFIFLAACFSPFTLAAPGAHGPNGEHLDSPTRVNQSVNPKFEAFSETFEMLGELKTNSLDLYLHDYATNVPVADAEIELETANLSAIARFDHASGHYLVNAPDFIARLSKAGEHEIIVTVLTELSGDLLAATLMTPIHEETSDLGEHHHHFPWWIVGLCIGVFVLGFVIGRLNRGRQA